MLNLLRLLCLLVLVLAGVTAWAWNERSEWIASVEWHVIDRYQGPEPKRIGEIKAAIRQGDHETHLQELDKIRLATERFEYGDRKFETWRAAVGLQTDSLVALKRFDQAMEFLPQAVQKLPRSISLALHYAHCLSLSDRIRDRREAQDWIKSWSQRFPNHPHWNSSRQFLALQSRDFKRIARDLDHDMLSATLGAARNWQMFLYPVGDHPVPVSPMTKLEGPDQDGRFSMEIDFGLLPHEVRQIRLDPPTKMPLLIEDPRLQVWDGDELVDSLTDMPFNHFDGAWLAPEGFVVVEPSLDQKLNIRLASPVTFENAAKVRFEFKMQATLGWPCREALSDPQDREALKQAIQEFVQSSPGFDWSVDRLSPPLRSAP